MLSGKETTKAISTKKSTGFKLLGGNGLKRIVDVENQITMCTNCKFTAPLSISYEHFIWLHQQYNHIVGGDGPCVYQIFNNDGSQDIRIIKLDDTDRTTRCNSY
ncbi:hypothetical protein [Chrysodeixis includens nucleopolyhedrovirus]|uniref:Uncharacterized protein n=1 Tax=Chrysodeixis includens nucleopolyhedrovirus TaxID=1207438 RepID=A0A5B8YTV7_9ABAC|nr:hypothetical protein QKU06_gp043 [Chrysodeixis includens nucleopolyhedrovirus]QED40571.1 hypothetical protein [Chrysodeixis includens nucleopolyhedrovirus]